MCPASCKSPQKTVTELRQAQETDIRNDISSTDEKQLKELADQVMKRLTDERLNIDVRQVKYDTGKPVDSVTGKHPVSEETGISIRKETKINETDAGRRETDAVSVTKIKDDSRTVVKAKTETKEEKQTGLSGLQRKLIAAGIFSITGFIVFIITKIKK
jgi:hypothetical protein